MRIALSVPVLGPARKQRWLGYLIVAVVTPANVPAVPPGQTLIVVPRIVDSGLLGLS